MLRIAILWIVVTASGVYAQSEKPLVTLPRLEVAIEQATASYPPDDPQRETLLRLYGDTRADLAAIDQYTDALEQYSLARSRAAAQAQTIKAGLSERDVSSDHKLLPGKTDSLQEIEQAIQVYRAELDARLSRSSELGDQIAALPGRSLDVRNRLTELGSELPRLSAALALLPTDVETGGRAEAELWLAQVRVARAAAEKEALDAELLSQPMRLELLKAQRDQTNQDIGMLQRRLEALERRAGLLRQGEADQARAKAEIALADTVGKHRLVRQLADINASLTGTFAERSTAIESVRSRETSLIREVDRLESDLKEIERKIDLLGMSKTVGQILREQEVRLPKRRESKKAISSVDEMITQTSVRQIELEDERRKLQDAQAYVDGIVEGESPAVGEQVRQDLLDLARARAELINQAIDIESTYAGSLGSLDSSLRRYARVADTYHKFISERLLWMPSRDPFSLFRVGLLRQQVVEVFAPARWSSVLRQFPAELMARPAIGLGLVLVVLLFYVSPRLAAAVKATGRDVGYVRTDSYTSTLKSLTLSLLLSFKWPMLLLLLARLFEMQERESELATALYVSLARGAMYLWGIEFIRMILMPKGLVEAHFRWPTRRTEALRRRVLRLEQTFFPAVLFSIFFIQLYSREVGGPLGACAIIMVLLSLSQFFRKLPHFFQDVVEMMVVDGPASRSSAAGRIVRQLLVWVPLLGIVAVLFGYIYAAIEFSLLLSRTVVLACLVLLFHELGLRWLRMTRRRMVAKVRLELAQGVSQDEGEEELLENDPELLRDEGTKLLNLLTLLGSIIGLILVWSDVIPALGFLDSVELWSQASVVDGREVLVPVTLANIAVALAIAVLGWVALRRIPSLLEILLRQKMRVRPASAYAATRVFQYAATGTLVALVLGSLGGSWSQIQWAVAALSVGIGFGLQEIVANFISGLIILFEQPVRVGDTVTVGNVSGRVTKIRIRATTIRDFDNRELLVPNKEFITQQLLNWSLSDQVTRWVLEVGVAYGTDLDKAMAIVSDVAKQHPLILADPEPLVTFEQFGDSSLLIKLRFFLDQLDQRLKVASSVMLDINRRFNEQGIVVAFPQRDVHLDTSTPLDIRMVDQPPADAR